jgi:hypothetical protein
MKTRTEKIVTQEELLNNLCLEWTALANRKILFRKLARGYKIEPGKFDIDHLAEREFVPCIAPSLERTLEAVDKCSNVSVADSVPTMNGYRRSYRRRRQELKEHGILP